MAESGEFRSSLHGFHRQDVLRYIEALKSEHQAREDMLLRQLDEARQAAAAAQALSVGQADELARLREQHSALSESHTQLEELVHEHNRQNRLMRDQLEQYKAAAQELKQTQETLADRERELQSLSNLRTRCETAEQTLQQSRTYGRQLTSRLRALEEENARLRAALDGICARIDEVQVCGQSFLAASCRYSEERLTALEDSVSVLEAQLGETRQRIGEERAAVARQNDAAGVRLQELLSSLQTEEAPAGELPSAEEAQRFFETAPAAPETEAAEASASAPTGDTGAPETERTPAGSRDTVYVRRSTPYPENGKLKKWLEGWLPRDK